jgi:hypothetical protein
VRCNTVKGSRYVILFSYFDSDSKETDNKALEIHLVHDT